MIAHLVSNQALVYVSLGLSKKSCCVMFSRVSGVEPRFAGQSGGDVSLASQPALVTLVVLSGTGQDRTRVA